MDGGRPFKLWRAMQLSHVAAKALIYNWYSSTISDEAPAEAPS
jgi:hypothetical protein